ncbi:uncharacterized protein LOC100376030 [Saccoglossus kowalevskii]|uniref:Flocculation protein FLO11-like n=1 Tax=Saccoglossus kowalevskii TaxID=10224 RepID=A0ABM0MNW9_SACKO|nr:PREDICTED: flocculation protein FLO11-like [Saccoglossus kowalevskii]
MADSNPLREFVSNLPRLDPGRLRPSKRTTTKRPFTFSPDWDVSRNSPNTTSDPDSTDTEGNLTPQSRRVSLPASVSIHKSELEASESLPTPETRRVSLPAHVSLNQSKLVSSLPERVRSLSGRKPSPQSHRIDSPASSVASGRSGLSTPRSAKKGSAHKSSPQSSRTKSPAVIVPDQSELSTTKSLRNRSVREPTPQSKRNESPVPVVSDQSELPTPKRLRNRSVREPTPPSKRTESPVPVVSDQSELPTPKSLRNRSVRKPTPQSKRTESPVPVVSDQSELLTTKRLRNRSVHEPTPQSKRTESPVSVSLAQSGLSPVKDQGKSTYEAIDQSAGTETESVTKTDDQLTDVLLVSNPEQQSSDQQSPTKSVHFKQDLQRLPQPVIANASDAPLQRTQPTIRHSALKANKVASLQTPGKRTSPRGQSPELETQHGSFLYTTLPFESGPVVRRKRRRSKTPPAVQDNTLPIETG